MVKYQLMNKRIELRDVGKPFTVGDGKILSVAKVSYNEDYSMTLMILVELHDA